MSSAHTERRELDLAGINAAEVASFNGPITIETGPTPPRLEVGIKGHATYKLERIGQLLYVVGKKRGLTYLGSGVSIALWLPPGLTLKLANVNSAITVHGAVGGLEAIASGGTITTEATGHGELRLTATSGTIAVRAAEGGVKAINSSGAIQLSEVAGRVDATTSNGDVRLDGVSGPMYLTTTKGAISITDAQGHVFINAANGSVRIADTQGQIQISGHNGAVRLERISFAAGSQSWVSIHNGGIEALGVRAPEGLSLRAKTHQHVIQADLPDYSVRTVRKGMGLKARLAGERPASLDLIGHGTMRITSQAAHGE